MTSCSPVPLDAERIARCAAIIDIPKAEAPDSFILHAPLEFLARTILLARAPSTVREPGYQRLEWLAEKYETAGPGAERSTPVPALVEGDTLTLSLAAAGHAPIFESLRPRVPDVGSMFGARLVAAELDRHPDWHLIWPRHRDSGGFSSGDLAERLAAPQSPGDPGSDFIFPMMHLVDQSGLAAALLDDALRGVSVADARRILLRVAAQSMLQDDPAAAAYQWTHCLTLPQAVLLLAGSRTDPEVAVAVAATYVLGFRAIKGRVRLDGAWTPDRNTAAGRVWWAPDDALSGVIDGLISTAVVHPDAHLVKYTLACLDAAELDPEASRLFLAAAAHLQDWWRSDGMSQHAGQVSAPFVSGSRS
jgi:hypothetical protein